MKVRFSGYKVWKHLFDELELFTFYILPTITIHQDRTYEVDEYRTEIKFAWLFWELEIYLKY